LTLSDHDRRGVDLRTRLVDHHNGSIVAFRFNVDSDLPGDQIGGSPCFLLATAIQPDRILKPNTIGNVKVENWHDYSSRSEVNARTRTAFQKFSNETNGKPVQAHAQCSIAERAAVLARIGTRGESPLVPVDPDRLAAAERSNHAGGLVSKFLQPFDDGWRYSILELINALVMQAAWHVDRFLHVAAVVEHVGQDMHLPDRLILPAHHAERHHGTAILRHQAGDDRVQRPLAGRDAVRMPRLNAETTAAILQQDTGVVRHDRGAESMRDGIDERADVTVLVHDGDVDGRRVHWRRHHGKVEHAIHPDLAAVLLREFRRQNSRDVDIDVRGIADVLLAHHVGYPRGLGFQVKALSA